MSWKIDTGNLSGGTEIELHVSEDEVEVYINGWFLMACGLGELTEEALKELETIK